MSPNAASFVGATTVRVNQLGATDVDPAPEKFEWMKALVRQAMNEGAMGLGSSLIYALAAFAETPELIALAGEAGKCGGMYISHRRDEGPRLLEAMDELIEILEKAGTRAEIFHLKQSGRDNSPEIGAAIANIEAARAGGVRVTANMYTYPASATGLDAAMPLWVREGGIEAGVARLKQPEARARLIAEMRALKGSENMKLVEEPEKVLLLGFRTEALKPFDGRDAGRSREEAGEEPGGDRGGPGGRGRDADPGRLFRDERSHVARQTSLPWMSFGSDATSQSPEGVFLKSSTHPRAYGTFAPVLGKYVREEKTLTLQEAMRRLSALPAANLQIGERAALKAGYFADVVASIQRRSGTMRPTTSRSNSRPGCGMCSSKPGRC